MSRVPDVAGAPTTSVRALDCATRLSERLRTGCCLGTLVALVTRVVDGLHAMDANCALVLDGVARAPQGGWEVPGQGPEHRVGDVQLGSFVHDLARDRTWISASLLSTLRLDAYRGGGWELGLETLEARIAPDDRRSWTSLVGSLAEAGGIGDLHHDLLGRDGAVVPGWTVAGRAATSPATGERFVLGVVAVGG